MNYSLKENSFEILASGQIFKLKVLNFLKTYMWLILRIAFNLILLVLFKKSVVHTLINSKGKTDFYV